MPAPALGPYAGFTYTVSQVKAKINASEGRISPVSGAPGHPRQHAGKWDKAEHHATGEGRTKSVFVNTDEQDKAVASALRSPAGIAALTLLDAAPLVPSRRMFTGPCAAEVMVVKAKKKVGSAAGVVKSWDFRKGLADRVTVIIDSRGTGTPGDIHIQTAFPVLD